MTPFGYTILGFGGGKNQTYTPVSEDIPTGTQTTFAAHYAAGPHSDWISADKFIAIWSADNASPAYSGRSIVGTVSGTSISFGSMVHYSSDRAYQQSVASDPFNDDKFVVIFENNTDIGHGYAVVGTVSGTTPSYGTQVEFDDSGACRQINVAFDPNTENKFVVVYQDYGNSSYGTACVGTISGTSVSFGSEVVFNSASTFYCDIAFDKDAAGKCVITYSDQGNSSYGTAIVGTVSGTSISFGTEVVYESAGSNYTCIASDPFNANKFVLAYQDTGNSNYGTAIVGTMSGTSISFGTPAVWLSGGHSMVSIDCDPNTENKFVIASKGSSAGINNGAATVGTISGTSLSFGSVNQTGGSSLNNGAQCIKFSPSAANAGKFVVTYRDNDSSAYGKAVLGQIESQTPDP